MSAYYSPVGPRIEFHSKRETQGFTNTLMQALEEDEAEFHDAFRMDIATFNELLNMAQWKEIQEWKESRGSVERVLPCNSKVVA